MLDCASGPLGVGLQGLSHATTPGFFQKEEELRNGVRPSPLSFKKVTGSKSGEDWFPEALRNFQGENAVKDSIP